MHRYSLTSDTGEMWTLRGTAGKAPIHFCNLAAALDFARKDAEDREADIELLAGGLYMFVHQTHGWPHRLCREQKSAGEGGTIQARNSASAVRLVPECAARPQYPGISRAKPAPPTKVYRHLWTGVETAIVMGLFVVLAAVALSLRARLGFVL